MSKNTHSPSVDTVKGAPLVDALFSVKPVGYIALAANVAEDETIVVGGVTYKFTDDVAVVTKPNLVSVNVVSFPLTPANAVTAFKAAMVRRNQGIDVSDGVVANTMRLRPVQPSAGTIVITETMAGSGNTASSIQGGGTRCVGDFKYAPTAADVAEGSIQLVMVPPHGKQLLWATATVVTVGGGGAITKKAWDGAVTCNATTGLVTLSNAGSVDWATTDIVVVSPIFA